MLPTTGFFKDIDCAYYETTCGRPYCHFRHRKKNQESSEESSHSSAETPNEIPTYKPTPKSELASTKSHIPISYVPDLVIRSDRSIRPVPTFNIAERPTYKPTPISLLSSTNVASKCEYTPTSIKDINVDILTNEFDMIDEILNDSNKEKIQKENKSSLKSKKVHGEKKKDLKSSKEVEKTKEKSKTSSKSREGSSSSKEKKHEKEDDRHRKDKYGRSSSKSKHKDKEKDSKSNEQRSKSNHKEKSSREKDKSRSSRKKDEKKKNDKNKEKRKSKEKHKEKELFEKKSEPAQIESDDENNDLALDEEFDDTIEEECYKIFSEYKPPILDQQEVPENLDQLTKPEPYNPVSKKRVAYEKADKSSTKITLTKTKHSTNVALVMTNRIKIARQAQADNEQKNLVAEIKHQGIKRISSQAVAEPVEKQQKIAKIAPKVTLGSSLNGKIKPQVKTTSLVDDILSGKSTVAKPRRIAPVSNVLSIQLAKAKLDEMARNKANTLKTAVQTVTKGAKRVAHTPDTSLAMLPDVLQAERSKLPVNVRTKYLTLLAEECIKLYVSMEDAYQRALNEEVKCYERCTALTTYRNSTMLAVNRLRKEVQERELSGLGPLQSGETTGKSNDCSFQGKRFYDNISGFILTEEELLLHGYPRDGPTPGKAIVNSDQRQVSHEHLEDNERICCRCHKLYLIDENGFPLFEEECIYHPLRKRTLRGERTYLCCKSTDDTGCAMSNTHVSEVSAEHQLEGYQSTMESDKEDDPRSYAVYALDCEMCYTTKGLELTRVTIVDVNLKTVYESLVKPLNPIIDYNTRFSGITKEQMDRTSTSILQVQANILHLCNSKTILIGHSLESDMKALKIIHSTIIDTAIMFPHKFGLPHKRALRVLASELLKKIIQNDVGGHDSAEDALTCMELVIWKVKEDLKVKGIKS